MEVKMVQRKVRIIEGGKPGMQNAILGRRMCCKCGVREATQEDGLCAKCHAEYFLQ